MTSLLDEIGDVWSHEEADSAATDRVVAVAIACGPDVDREGCSRIAADLADRTALTEEQRTRATARAGPAITAIQPLILGPESAGAWSTGRPARVRPSGVYACTWVRP